jgi:hypothetical protein
MLASGVLQPAAAAVLGVYEGNEPADVVRFDKWLGCRAGQILVFTDPTSWENIAHPEWFIDRFRGLHRPALWSVSLIPQGAKLEDAADGSHDAYYKSAARTLARAHPDRDGVIRVRLGWELNGDWMPWAAEGHEQAFIAAFRHAVDSFRSVSSKFRFEWNINYGRPMDPATAYPGDEYVDVIGMDFYWMQKYLGSDPVKAFDLIRNDRFGLDYIQAFAKTHHKPVAFSEWGVQGNNAKPFIDRVKNWIDAHHIIYHDYWDSDASYSGRLSDGRWSDTGAAFRQAFCPVQKPNELNAEDR